MKTKFIFFFALLTFLFTSCSQTHRRLTVMTHDSFEISAEIMAAFQNEHQIQVEIIKVGDAGTAVNKAALSKNAPLADVFYGVDNTFLSRALDEDIFETYESPLLEDIPDDFEIDPENRALPVNFGDVCLNYDTAYFVENNLTPPANLDDLLKSEYQSLLVGISPCHCIEELRPSLIF